MKDFPEKYFIITNNPPRVIVDRLMVDIGYKNTSNKALGFIFTYGAGSIVPDGPTLYHYLDNFLILYSLFYFLSYTWQVFE